MGHTVEFKQNFILYCILQTARYVSRTSVKFLRGRTLLHGRLYFSNGEIGHDPNKLNKKYSLFYHSDIHRTLSLLIIILANAFQPPRPSSVVTYVDRVSSSAQLHKYTF